ncbi:unnamed protein product [Spirodela intermedia]|uniref:Protein kinase domain-containing protein n=1 Tax=Spirodela intermedia TaxID=51605 RepID=A0A7I8J1V4_SPIIN|nr:unnamed protein product [Spirodela intermedia]CAA6663793.1 unnamed protein product [Spirodela intermedia]
MEPVIQALLAACGSFFLVSLLFGVAILCLHAFRNRSSRVLNLPSRGGERPRAGASINESVTFDPSLDRISMARLAAATGNFAADRIVGDGSFGFVYRAEMPDGRTVAVKKLSPDAFHGFREFRAEVETLGRIRHQNLARILGYCVSGSDRLLIYEFLEQGSLDQWLHETSSSRPPLPWAARLGVIRGVAAGLAFLHADCKPPSSTAISRPATITDFGLARRVDSSRSHVSTQVAGTMGYMPPEYRDGLTAATVKADVYSFGILMFEVASGRRGGARALGAGPRGGGSGLELLDPALMGGEGAAPPAAEEEQVKGFLTVAHRCTSNASRARPSMGEVLNLLDQL